MNVQDVMTRNPMTMPVTASVGDVAQAMRDEEVRHVPVMQGATMVGIVSDRDLRSISMPRLVDQAAVESLKSRYDEPISTLMASDPVKVYPTTELAEVVDLMIEYRVGAVPVVEPSTGDLVGIVSYVDLLRALASRLAE